MEKLRRKCLIRCDLWIWVFLNYCSWAEKVLKNKVSKADVGLKHFNSATLFYYKVYLVAFLNANVLNLVSLCQTEEIEAIPTVHPLKLSRCERLQNILVNTPLLPNHIIKGCRCVWYDCDYQKLTGFLEGFPCVNKNNLFKSLWVNNQCQWNMKTAALTR